MQSRANSVTKADVGLSSVRGMTLTKNCGNFWVRMVYAKSGRLSYARVALLEVVDFAVILRFVQFGGD